MQFIHLDPGGSGSETLGVKPIYTILNLYRKKVNIFESIFVKSSHQKQYLRSGAINVTYLFAEFYLFYPSNISDAKVGKNYFVAWRIVLSFLLLFS